MSDDQPKGLAAWMSSEDRRVLFGVSREPTPRRLLFDTARWQDRWAWRWYRARAWVARVILRVVVL